MAKRQQPNLLEGLIALTSKLPWQISAVLAVFSYVILHTIASRPPTRMTAPGQMGNVALHSLFNALAMLGQFILPFAFIVGAIISVFNAVKRRKLYEGVQARADIGSLNDMSWEDFEYLVGEHFCRDGFQISRNGGNGPDGGIDLVLRRGGETYLVQCKQWRAYRVGVQPVREFYGVMAANGATGGYFVTSGVFTADALRFVHGLNLELIDGKKLKTIIGSAVTRRAPWSNAQRRSEPLPFAPRPEVLSSNLMSPQLLVRRIAPVCSSLSTSFRILRQ